MSIAHGDTSVDAGGGDDEIFLLADLDGGGSSINGGEGYDALIFIYGGHDVQVNSTGEIYVIDETQEVARAYGAVCTPDFFGYNKDLKLQYRGRLDASKTTPIPGAIRELYEAMVQVAETGRGPEQQIPSMGCSIKWKAAA